MSGQNGVVAEMAEGVLQKMESSIHVLRETSRRAGKLLNNVISLKDEIEFRHAKLLEMGYSESSLNRIRCSLYDCNELVEQIYSVAKKRQKKQSLILEIGWGWCGSNCCYATECLSFDSKYVSIMLHRFRDIKDDDPGSTIPSNVDTGEVGDVIGRDVETDKIVNMLLHSGHAGCSGDHIIPVISVFGTEGLGKSTLAKHVCSDPRVTDCFQLIFWVPLGHQFQLSYIIAKIVDQADKNGTSLELHSLDLQQLQIRLQQIIRGKKFLLVLDNVRSYDIDNWCNLLKLLSTGSPESAILTTTRSEQLASTMSSGKNTYELEHLTNDHSQSLFKTLTVQGGATTDPEFAAIGERIVKKTGNVPRTIKFAAKKLLSLQPKSSRQLAESNWEKFLLDPSSGVTDHQLPYPLKRCLAYCAIFPTNHTINKCHLIHLWIALGFIHHPLSDTHQTLEDAGEEHFMNLQNWSLFKHLRNDEVGNIIFSMDQIPLYQARSMAGSEIMVFQDSTTRIPDGVYHLLFDSRHLSVGNSGSGASSSSNTSLKELISSVPAQLRSFLMLPRSNMDLDKSDYDKLFSRLKHLHALDLHGSKMKVVPNSIGSLKQLRYLNLSDNEFPSLPNSITKLSNLQVLDLSKCKSLRELPRLLRRLESLRHLYLGGCNSLIGMPAGIGGMTSLQTLSHFVLSKGQNSCKLDELNRLNLKSELTFVFACKQQP